MNYQEVIDFLFNQTPQFHQIGSLAYKEGLENTWAIDSHLNHPHTHYHTIHVAGTNGKGSTSHLLASILYHSGYRVGLYTSPHLICFTERIRINGIPINKTFITDFIDQNYYFFQQIKPSFFEITTGMAFAYFEKEKVDVAVIETGLGGRLDCTNVIRPDLCVITNVSFDHIDLLGNTLKSIAQEKAGIIKPGIPVVIGEADGEVKQVFLEKASQSPSVILFAEDEKPIKEAHLNPSGQWIFQTKEYHNLTGELGGLAQKKNVSTVLCAVSELKKLGYRIPLEAIQQGFQTVVQTTGLKGRWQVVGIKPKVVLDIAHNMGSLQYVVRQLQTEQFRRLHIVFGMVNDKDISGVLQLLPKDAIYYFTKASVKRAKNENDLRAMAEKTGLVGRSFPTVKEAVHAAKQAAGSEDFIFTGGSTFVVADALGHF